MDAAVLAHGRVAGPAGDVERSEADRHSRFLCHPRCCASERQKAAAMTASEQVLEQTPQQHQAAEQMAALLATAAAVGYETLTPVPG